MAPAAADVVVIGAILLLERFTLPVIQRWSRGAAGEERVGQVLEALQADGCLAMHDVSIGRGNIDHVLVGPAGLFTIETKSHRRRVTSSRIDARMLKQAYAEAKALNA